MSRIGNERNGNSRRAAGGSRRRKRMDKNEKNGNNSEQEKACLRLQEAVAERSEEMEDRFWEALQAFQNVCFATAKGLAFSYEIRGGEMFFSRKVKSITRATAMMAFHKALEVQEEEGFVGGPKRLGTFGASYLYPVLIGLGVIDSKRPEG